MKKLLSTPIVQVIPKITIKDVVKLYCYYELARMINASIDRHLVNSEEAIKVTVEKGLNRVVYGKEETLIEEPNESDTSAEQGVQ